MRGQCFPAHPGARAGQPRGALFIAQAGPGRDLGWAGPVAVSHRRRGPAPAQAAGSPQAPGRSAERERSGLPLSFLGWGGGGLRQRGLPWLSPSPTQDGGCPVPRVSNRWLCAAVSLSRPGAWAPEPRPIPLCCCSRPSPGHRGDSTPLSPHRRRFHPRVRTQRLQRAGQLHLHLWDPAQRARHWAQEASPCPVWKNLLPVCLCRPRRVQQQFPSWAELVGWLVGFFK